MSTIRTCASRKLISHSIKPPTVRNDDVGHRLLEIVLPFQGLATAPIAIQDYPSPATDAYASDDNNQNSWSRFVSDDARSTPRHDPGNLAGCCQSHVPQKHSAKGFAALRAALRCPCYGRVSGIVSHRCKRLANCIYPVPAGVAMMSSPSIDLPRGHHESKPNQKRGQSPALV